MCHHGLEYKDSILPSPWAMSCLSKTILTIFSSLQGCNEHRRCLRYVHQLNLKLFPWRTHLNMFFVLSNCSLALLIMAARTQTKWFTHPQLLDNPHCHYSRHLLCHSAKSFWLSFCEVIVLSYRETDLPSFRRVKLHLSQWNKIRVLAV